MYIVDFVAKLQFFCDIDLIKCYTYFTSCYKTCF